MFSAVSRRGLTNRLGDHVPFREERGEAFARRVVVEGFVLVVGQAAAVVPHHLSAEVISTGTDPVRSDVAVAQAVVAGVRGAIGQVDRLTPPQGLHERGRVRHRRPLALVFSLNRARRHHQL